jgi:hypothetical protein
MGLAIFFTRTNGFFDVGCLRAWSWGPGCSLEVMDVKIEDKHTDRLDNVVRRGLKISNEVFCLSKTFVWKSNCVRYQYNY